MRITRRNNNVPPTTLFTIFYIPFCVYIIEKISGTIFKREYNWWLLLLILFIITFFLIFKITNNKNDKN